MKYLDLTVDLPPAFRHPMDEFLRSTDAVAREELVTWNFSGDGLEYALFHIEGDIDRYRARIDDVDSIREYGLRPIDGESFYAYVCQESRGADREWRSAFARRSLVVVPPIVFDETGMDMTVVGEADSLRAVLDDLPESVEVTVHEIGDYDRRQGTIAGAVTDRQYEAVRTAVDLGYYAVPREAALADVAAALDCAESTASTLLRRAEATVMGRLADR